MDKALKILLLEDSELDVELAQYHLNKSGLKFEMQIADTKEEFINALDNFSPDIVLSDHTLPQFNSFGALDIVKEKNLKIPFILLTGSVSEEFAAEIIKQGASDYILKDRMVRLPAAIHNALERYKLELERQKYFDKVSENEALMKETEQIARVGSWQTDLVKKTTKWSEELYRILGFKVGEVKPSFENFVKRVHPDDLNNVKFQLENASRNLDAIQLNFRIQLPDGVIKFIRSEVVITRDEEKNPVKLSGFNQDVTKEKQTQESLDKSEANLKTIFDNTEIAYILFDRYFNILSFNKITNKWFELETGKKLIHDINFIDQLINNESKKKFKEYLDTVFNGNHIQYETNLKNEKIESWYRIRLFPVSNNDNEVFGAIMAINDITEQKLSEIYQSKITSDIIQRNRNLEQFAYIVSHNLRGPVANIMGYSEILKDMEYSEEERSELLGHISSSVIKLDDVIKDLNDILRIKNSITEQIEIIDLSALTENIKFSIANLIENQQVEINTNFSEINEISSIKSFIHSIFYNLITNSIKYRKLDVPLVISIKSRIHTDKIELIFKDNGIGIDVKKNKESIFGLYKRFHLNIEGKGVGLFMVKTQIETLGGKIKIQSKINEGTKFIIEFEK